ncbi:DUF3159 domain-containing protein [Streptomyces tubercidicus]|uniref:DUF3159 domain-containing protein n=1 Tax=Streptomyces tubercidicus TaxID=47759 RepID=A0A640UQE8_9ACTN|nr:DUF3159 domain-containing protein [Streptomyces tubercidicus]WAU12505.1 DUF3159 domain-containing protein [Streptomyces tubercidicus]GFE37949.1 hypothetical protein Stube_26220 [Streptomyces tubercidicus]
MDPAADPAPGGADAVRIAVRKRLRSTVIDVTPVFGFTLTFALTHRLGVALTLALAAGAGVFLLRLVRKEPVRQALAVLAVVCVQGVLAGRTGDATNFFLPHLVLHGVMAVVTPVLLWLGWPPLGVMVGLATGERTAWRRCTVRRRAFAKGHLVLYAGNLLMLSVQLPLFLAGEAVALGTVDVFQPLVLAIGALLGWRVYRRSVGTHRCEAPVGTSPAPSLPAPHRPAPHRPAPSEPAPAPSAP